MGETKGCEGWRNEEKGDGEAYFYQATFRRRVVVLVRSAEDRCRPRAGRLQTLRVAAQTIASIRGEVRVQRTSRSSDAGSACKRQRDRERESAPRGTGKVNSGQQEEVEGK